ncbi:MAG: hypothetical protein IJ071_08755 [Ruminococcus sp.]|nr:hypothetical protein [Ruminococcus sp.]
MTIDELRAKAYDPVIKDSEVIARAAEAMLRLPADALYKSGAKVTVGTLREAMLNDICYRLDIPVSPSKPWTLADLIEKTAVFKGSKPSTMFLLKAFSRLYTGFLPIRERRKR